MSASEAHFNRNWAYDVVGDANEHEVDALALVVERDWDG